MIYPFNCPECGHYTEAVRPYTQCSEPEMCEKCGTQMNRVFTVPQVSIPETGYFDVGLGQYIGNRRDKQDAIRRVSDEHGVQVEEVGDQKVKPKPARKDIDIPNELVDRIWTDD